MRCIALEWIGVAVAACWLLISSSMPFSARNIPMALGTGKDRLVDRRYWLIVSDVGPSLASDLRGQYDEENRYRDDPFPSEDRNLENIRSFHCSSLYLAFVLDFDQ